MSYNMHIWPLAVGIVLMMAGGLLIMVVGPEDLSDDAVAALVTAGIAVLGTHVGHVSGHKLAKGSAHDFGATDK